MAHDDDKKICDMPLEEARSTALTMIAAYVENLELFADRIRGAESMEDFTFLYMFSGSVEKSEELPCYIGVSMPADLVASAVTNILSLSPAIAYEAFSDIFSDPVTATPLISMMKQDMEAAIAAVKTPSEVSPLAAVAPEGTA